MQETLKKIGIAYSTSFPLMTIFADIMPLLQFTGLIISIVVGVTIIKMNITKTNLYKKQLLQQQLKDDKEDDD